MEEFAGNILQVLPTANSQLLLIPVEHVKVVFYLIVHILLIFVFPNKVVSNIAPIKVKQQPAHNVLQILFQIVKI